jgi:ATP phosphoribosyltransferase regulatory subunit
MSNLDCVLKSEERAVFSLRDLYRSYGYLQFKMSKFEEYDLYVRNKSFLVSDHIITFTDTNGRLMALKPDVTLSIVKNSKDLTDCTQKVYYDENVYRVSGTTSSYREILQAGLECIGRVDRYCKSEVLSLAYQSLALISPDFMLDVSHLGILSAAIDRIGVSESGRSAILSCVGEKNLHGIEEICRSEGIDPTRANTLRALMSGYGSVDTVLESLTALFAKDESVLAMIEELGDVLSALPTDRVHIDFSVVNDLGYYNGIVFQGFVNGISQRILSGGQYDNLMKKMGRRASAIGFALYLDLLEGLSGSARPYDVDAVLLYPADAPICNVTEAVKALTAEGKTVSAQTTLPEKLHCREIYQLTKEGVVCIETHA